MTRKPEISLRELESILQDQKKRLDDLKKKRTSIRKNLDLVQKDIAALEGKSGKRRGRSPTKTANKKKKVRRRRPKNARPLKAHVTQVLKGKKKGLALPAVRDRVLKSGYKTNSKDFDNVVYQCLYKNKEFVLDEKQGTYKLK